MVARGGILICNPSNGTCTRSPPPCLHPPLHTAALAANFKIRVNAQTPFHEKMDRLPH